MAVNIQFLSKALVVAFVSSVTFWYSLTPYIVQPHPDIINDLLTKTQLNSYINEDKSSSSSSVIEVENWTKWRLYVKADNDSSQSPSYTTFGAASSNSLSPKIIYAGARDQISLESKAVINMEWRPEYEIHIHKNDDLSNTSPTESSDSFNPISVHTEAPLMSFRHFGIYDHFRTSIKSASSGNDKIDDQKETRRIPYTVQIIPRFLFGIPYEKIQQLYGTNKEDGSIDLSRLPIVGLFSDTPTYDRFIIQAYMNLVTMSVIFLLWANNPPETLLGNKAKKPEPKANGTSKKPKTN